MALTQVNPALFAGSTNTTAVIQSNGTTAITVDASQNVTIGDTSVYGKFAVRGYSGTVSGFNRVAHFGDGVSGCSAYVLQGGAGSNTVGMFTDNGSGILTFGTNFTERMRIDTSGNVLANGTSSADSNAKIQAFSPSGNGAQGWIGSFTGGSGGGRANQNVGYMIGQTDLKIYADWDGSGNPRNKINVSAVSSGVQLTSGATSWAAISDERQKDIIEPIINGLTKVTSLRTVIGKYKIDADDRRRVFLIAQDVQAVLPEAVVIEDEGQETEKLLLSYTDVIPLLVASIKELKAELDTVKAELVALRNK